MLVAKNTEEGKLRDALTECKERLQGMLKLSFDWFWEQDESYRFTLITDGIKEKAGVEPEDYLGKTRWDVGGIVVTDGGWEGHEAMMEARRPFTDFIFYRLNSYGEPCYISSSGYPVFDTHGQFKGYRGIAKDVTQRIRVELRQTVERAVSHVLTVSNSIEEATPLVLKNICEILGWTCGRYWRWDEGRETLFCAEKWGTSSAEVWDFLASSFEVEAEPRLGGLIWRVWAEKSAVWVADIETESNPAWIAKAKSIGLRSAFAFPIRSGSRQFGVMEFFAQEIHRPDEELLRCAKYIGTHLGQFCQRIQSEEALRDAAQRFEGLIALSSDWYWELDENYRFISRKGGAAGATSLELDQAIGKTRWELPYIGTTEADWTAHRALLDGRKPFCDLVLKLPDSTGEIRRLSISGRPMFDDHGNFKGYCGIGKDITEKVKAEEALRESEARFRDLTDLSVDWYWEQDERFRYTVLAGGGLEKLKVDPNDYLGKARWEQPGMRLLEKNWDAHKATLEAHEAFSDLTYQWVDDAGKTRFVSSSGRPFFDSEGNFKGYRGVGQDITERVVAEERIQYLAYHDGLTALPNRAMFSEILNHGLNHARRYQKKLAVFFLDLDRFKTINDTLGHDAGDALLQEIGKRLKHCLRKSDTIARLGGDEFVVLLEEITDHEHISAIAEKILSSVVKPFRLLGQDFRVTASIGVSIFPDDGDDEQTLMKNADIALYRAKEEGKNIFQLYSEKMNAYSFQRLALESSLRRALERHEFLLHYQTRNDLRTGAVTGLEALLRWQHPDMGTISPAQFIPVAEETGLIVPIGKWVLRTACLQSKAWRKEGLPPMRIAINLSARQFFDEGMLLDITLILEETGMPPNLLELEITESIVMREPDKAVRLLTALKSMGIRLTIDDFGIGYCSLANIQRFPIDTIKLDRSFIRDLVDNPEPKALTEAIIAVGKSLSMTVVAEGVETQAQHDSLRERKCDEFQGYYFSKPLAQDKFTELLWSSAGPH